jgi:phosphatidylinositol 4-kinase
LDETNINNQEDEEENPDFENLNHSRSNTIASIRPPAKYQKKASNKLPPGKNRLEYEYDVDNLNSSYINADFNLSKPLMISVNPAIDKKATIMKKSSKNSTARLETELSVIPNKDSYEEDEIDMANSNYSNKNTLDEEIKNQEQEHKRVVNIASKFTIRPSGDIRKTVNPNNTKFNFGLKPAKTFMVQERKGSRPSIDDKDDNLDESSKKENNSDKNIIEINEENDNSLNSENKHIEEEDSSFEGDPNQEFFDRIFGQTIEEKENKLKKKSIFGKIKTHKIFRCIFKTHEDLRQEQFATQLINEFYQIFKLENTGCWLNTYEIISTGNNSGLVEMVDNSLSLDQLKQKTNHISLKNFYIKYYGKGSEESPSYKKAMDNYVASLAGYSLVCYFLQIKDRHNGNILIDNEGHLIHIDFGFLLSNAPGKGLKFENAPFKLSRDMVDCLGGVDGKYFGEFRKLLKKGFLAVNKHRAKIIILVEMMWCGHGKKLDCFEKGQEAINELKSRLNPKEGSHKIDVIKFVDTLIGQSVHNWRTKWYDIFQYYVQGIFY